MDVMQGEDMDYSVVLGDTPVFYEGQYLCLYGFMSRHDTLRLVVK